MKKRNQTQSSAEGLTPLDRLQRSRIQLLIHYPFFGQLAMYLKFIEQASVGTAATDGKNYFYNPKFIDKLSENELNFLTAHEVLHAALGHIWRRETRDRLLFNIAADLVVNAMIKELDEHASFFEMPEGGLYSKDFRDKSVEEVYDMLYNRFGKGKVPANLSSLDNHDAWDEAPTEDNHPSIWNERMIQSAQQCESSLKGGVPGSILRILKNLSEPKKNWRQLLADFVELEVNDYGFMPPDKRLLHADIILPDFSDQEERVRNIVFAVDTSGSISDKEYQMFISEIVGCMAQFEDKMQGTLIYCDDEVKPENIYDLCDVMDSMPRGGGGTDFIPVFDWIENHLTDCVGVVYLTDGLGTFPEEEPPYKVLWVLTRPGEIVVGNKNTVVPFGMTAHLDITSEI